MITDKNIMLMFKIQKDLEGISTLSFNGHISDEKFERITNELEDDLLNLLEKIQEILK